MAPRAPAMSCSTSAQPISWSSARSTASICPRMRRTRLTSLVFSRMVWVTESSGGCLSVTTDRPHAASRNRARGNLGCGVFRCANLVDLVVQSKRPIPQKAADLRIALFARIIGVAYGPLTTENAMHRNSFLALVLLGLMSTGEAHGQAWPTRQPIKLITPFPPGSAVDAVARPVFDAVSHQIGQSMVFESRAGAGGTLGMAAVAKAEGDGYTLLVNSSVHTITPTT